MRDGRAKHPGGHTAAPVVSPATSTTTLSVLEDRPTSDEPDAGHQRAQRACFAVPHQVSAEQHVRARTERD